MEWKVIYDVKRYVKSKISFARDGVFAYTHMGCCRFGVCLVRLPNGPIPEGFFEIEYRGRKDRLPFPRQAGSWYH